MEVTLLLVTLGVINVAIGISLWALMYKLVKRFL